jgi:uncharacterized protein (DUF885 family)
MNDDPTRPRRVGEDERPVARPDAAAVLADLAGRYWEDILHDDPLVATSLGDRRHDDRLPDPRPAARAGIRMRLAGLLENLGAVTADALGERDRVTRSALAEALLGDVARLDAGMIAGLDAWTVDPLEGPPSLFLDIPAYQPVGSPEQARAMVARWRAMGPYVDVTIANLRSSLGEGRAPTRSPVARVVEQLDRVARSSDADDPLLEPARSVLAGAAPAALSADEAAAFAAELREVVVTSVRPALARLRDALADEALPAARPDERPGLVHVAGGAEAYALLIRSHTSLALTAEALHETGLGEVERIDAEFADLGAHLLGTDGTAATLARLRGDPALRFATRGEIHAVAERSLDRARQAIPAWFGILPHAPCVVVPMGPHEEEHGTIAYYRQPAADGSRPGQYYINLSAPETRPRYEAEALAFHESIPGHHLQIAIGQELTGLPEFRKHLGPTAFFEGWGLYTERLAGEMDLYSGAMDRFGVLSFDAWRACRLVVDTGMHAMGWPRDRAIAFMREHTALGVNNIANEVDRYIVWPGQALAYKTGQLEILRLREEARAALGPAFDIRAFHDAVLGNGAVPLETLRDVVRRRMAAGRA